MYTTLPTKPCASFNEWAAYVRKSVVNAQLKEEAQIDIEAEQFVKSIKHQIINKTK
jgi:hypothetical protein